MRSLRRSVNNCFTNRRPTRQSTGLLRDKAAQQSGYFYVMHLDNRRNHMTNGDGAMSNTQPSGTQFVTLPRFDVHQAIQL